MNFSWHLNEGENADAECGLALDLTEARHAADAQDEKDMLVSPKWSGRGLFRAL